MLALRRILSNLCFECGKTLLFLWLYIDIDSSVTLILRQDIVMLDIAE